MGRQHYLTQYTWFSHQRNKRYLTYTHKHSVFLFSFIIYKMEKFTNYELSVSAIVRRWL